MRPLSSASGMNSDGGHQAVVAAPAHQRLEADVPAGDEVALRLQFDVQEVLLDGLAQDVLGLPPLLGGAQHVVVEEGVARPPGRLGVVERDVGALEHVAARQRAGHDDGDAHAETRGDGAPGERHRLLHRRHDAVEAAGQRLFAGGAAHDEGEFVAAHAADRRAAADRAGQPAADHHQQLVAGVVAERIVDRLEAVEVDEHEGSRAARPLRQHGIDPRHHHGAVGEAGQRILLGLPADGLLGRLQLGDVGAGGDGEAGAGAELAQLHPAAVGEFQHHRARRVAVLVHPLLDPGLDVLLADPGELARTRHAAHDGLVADALADDVPQPRIEAAELLVAGDETVLRVEGGDADGHRLQHVAQQLLGARAAEVFGRQRQFRLLALGDVETHRQVALDAPVAAGQRHDGGVDPVERAGFGAVADLAAPLGATSDGGPEAGEERPVVMAGAEDVVVASNQLLLGIAADAAEAGIGVENGAVAVGGRHDGVVVERLVERPQLVADPRCFLHARPRHRPQRRAAGRLAIPPGLGQRIAPVGGRLQGGEGIRQQRHSTILVSFMTATVHTER
jgi:hypothetical protein